MRRPPANRWMAECRRRSQRHPLTFPNPEPRTPHPVPSPTHAQYEILERALTRGQRVVLVRRGTELVVVPLRLRVILGREALEARHPSTGDALTLFLDELDAVEPVSDR